MPWLKHYPGPKAGLGDRCASAKCEGVPSWRLEAHGAGSFYCQDCKGKIDSDPHWGDLEDTNLSSTTVFQTWSDTVLELDRLHRIEAAAILLSDSVSSTFVDCRECGNQEPIDFIRHAKELRVALGLEPDLTVVDPLPF